MKRIFALILTFCFILSCMPNAFAASGADFSDMPKAGHWSEKALTEAVSNGLLNGNNGQLKPADNLTRAQMAAIINRAFGAIDEASLKEFSDVPGGKWYARDMAKAVEMETFQGDKSGTLRPDDFITRQEAFAVLARALKLSGGNASVLDKFTDGVKISSWAEDELASLVEAGYVNGSNGKLNPLSNISREEFAQVMYNAIKTYISVPGTYDDTYTGNVVIKTPGVILKNAQITGDLFIGEGVAQGSTVLDNADVTGRLVIRAGGSADGVSIQGDSDINEILVCDKTGVALEVGEKAAVVQIRVESNNAVITVANTEVVVAAGVVGTTVNGDSVLSGKTVMVENSKIKTDSANQGGTGGPGNPGGGGPGGPTIVNTTALSISPAAVSVTVGSSTTLVPGRIPASANDNITWASSDDTVAKVSSAGRISVIGTGDVTITAETASGIIASATVYAVMPPDGGDYTITEPGTVLNGGTFHNLTIAASVGTGNVTLNGVVVTGTLTTLGGGSHSIEINGGSYAEVQIQNAPPEGTRILTSGGAVLSSVQSSDNAIIETETGSTSTIGTITSSAPLSLVNTTLSAVSTSDNLILTGSSVGTLTTTGTSEISMDHGTTLDTVNAQSPTTFAGTGGTINQITASGDVTTGSTTTVGSITASGSADIMVQGSVGAISGTAGTVSVSGDAAPMISAITQAVQISGSASPIISGTTGSISLAASTSGTAGVTVTGTVTGGISTTGSGSVGSITLQNGTPTVSIPAGVSASQIAVTGTAAPTIAGSGTVETLVTTSTGTTTCDAPTTTVLSTAGSNVDGNAAGAVQQTTVTLDSITISNYPTKLVYRTSDTLLDTTGMVVTGYYRVTGFNGLVNRVLSASEYSDNWASIDKTAGIRTITITETDTGKTATYPITFYAKQVSAITVKALPSKLSYDLGIGENTLSLTGGKIDIIYTNSTLYPNEAIDMTAGGVTNSGFDATVGTKAITLTYSGKTTVFGVTVKNSVNEAKTAAIADLKVYAANKLLAATYSSTGQKSIKDAADAGITSITNATTTITVASALSSAKLAIDAVLTQNGEWEGKKTQYLNTYESVLALTVSTVDIPDKANVMDAKNAYALLESGVQAKLTAQKTLLDSLLAKIATLEAAQTLDAAKAAAASTVNTAYGIYDQSAYTTNYSSITAAKNTGLTNIAGATTVSGVISSQDAALNAMAAVKSDIVLLGEAKTAAVNTLSAYIPRGMTSSAYSSAYSATGKTQIGDYRTAGIIAINAAVSISAVNDCLAQYKGYIDAVKTITEINAAALAAAKTAAKVGLSAYGTLGIYRSAQQDEFTAAKAAGSTSIDNSTTIEAVNTALANAKTAINAIKTDAQLTAIELAAAKTQVKGAINGLKVKENYTTAGWALVTAKMSSWCAYVDACTTVDAITNQTSGAFKKASDDINTVPTADQDSVASAKSIIELGTYIAPQASAGTEEALKAWLASRINALTGMSATGITIAASSITVNPFTAAQAGTLDAQNGTNGSFSFTVTIAKGNATPATTTKSGDITATKYIPHPSITVAPADSTVPFEDDTLTLTATIHDILNPTYTWYKNTSNSTSGSTLIEGASSSTYKPVTASAGKTYYYCAVGETTSNIIAVTVASQLASAIPQVTVTGMAANYTLPYTGTITLELSSTATTYTYQWQSSSNGTDWSDINNATSSTCQISSLTNAMNGTHYRCKVTNTELHKSPVSVNTADVVLHVGKGMQSAPDAVAVSPTAKGASGSITGVTTAMEFSINGTDWSAVTADMLTGDAITGLAPGTYYLRYAATDDLAVSPAQTLTILDPTIANVTTAEELSAAIANTVVETININANITVSEGMTTTKSLIVNKGNTLTITQSASFTISSLWLDGGSLVNTGTITNNGEIGLENGSTFTNAGTIENKGTISVCTTLVGTTESNWIKSEFTNSGTLHQCKDTDNNVIGFIQYVAYVDNEDELITANNSTSFTAISVVASEKPASPEETVVTLTQSITVHKDITVWRFIFDGMSASEAMKLVVNPGVTLTAEDSFRVYGNMDIKTVEGNPGRLIINGSAEVGPNGLLTNDGVIADNTKLFVWANDPGATKIQFVNNGTMIVNGELNVRFGNATNNGIISTAPFNDTTKISGVIHLDGGKFYNNSVINNNGSISVDNGGVFNNPNGALVRNDGDISAISYLWGAESNWVKSFIVNNGTIQEHTDTDGSKWNIISQEAWTDNEAGFWYAANNSQYTRIALAADNNATTQADVHNTVTLSEVPTTQVKSFTLNKDLTIWRYYYDWMPAGTSDPMILNVANGFSLTVNGVLTVYGELGVEATGSLIAKRDMEVGPNGTLTNAGTLDTYGFTIVNCYRDDDTGAVLKQGRLINNGTLNVRDNISINGGLLINNYTNATNNNATINIFAYDEETEKGGSILVDEGELTNNGIINNNRNIAQGGTGRIYTSTGHVIHNNGSIDAVSSLYGYSSAHPENAVFGYVNDGLDEGYTDGQGYHNQINYQVWTDTADGLVYAAQNGRVTDINLSVRDGAKSTDNAPNSVILTPAGEFTSLTINKPLTIWRWMFDDNSVIVPMTLTIGNGFTLTMNGDLKLSGTLINNGTMTSNKYVEIRPNGNLTNNGSLTMDAFNYISSNTEDGATSRGQLINNGTMSLNDQIVADGGVISMSNGSHMTVSAFIDSKGVEGQLRFAKGGELNLATGSQLTNNGYIEICDDFYGAAGSTANKIFSLNEAAITGTGKLQRYTAAYTEAGLVAAMSAEYPYVDIAENITLTGNMIFDDEALIDGGKTLTVPAGSTLTVSKDLKIYGTLVNNGTVTVADGGSISLLDDGAFTNNGTLNGDIIMPAADLAQLMSLLGNDSCKAIRVTQPIEVSSDITISKDLYVDNDFKFYGNVTVDSGVKVTVNRYLEANAAFTNKGSILIQNGGEMKVSDSGSITNNGEIRCWYGWFNCNWETLGVFNGNQVVNYANRADIARELYNALKDGYGFTALASDGSDLDAYAAQFSDWNEMSNGKPDTDSMNALAFLLKNGIMFGVSENALRPYDYINRAQAAVILYRVVEKLKALNTITDLVGYNASKSVSFTDVTDTGAYYYTALMYLAKSDVISGTADGKFLPADPIVSSEINGVCPLSALIERFVTAIGTISSSETEIIAHGDQGITISNKVYTNPVTIKSDDAGTQDNGGNLSFVNCTFSAGLTILLGTQPYRVDFMGYPVGGSNTITVGPNTAKTGLPTVFDNVSMTIDGVANGTIVNSTVRTYVQSRTAGTSFTLNGVAVHGVSQFADIANVGDTHWFAAQTDAECFDHMGPYTGSHDACQDKFASMSFGGQISSVDASNAAGLAGLPLLRYAMFNDIWNNVSLQLNVPRAPDGDTRYVRLFSNQAFGFNVTGSVGRSMEICRIADISNTEFAFTGGEIVIGAWEQGTSVNIGTNAVRVNGVSNGPVAITASTGARIVLGDQNQDVRINSDSFGVHNAHVFGTGSNYSVFVDTANKDAYTFALSQKIFGEQITLQPLTFAVEVFAAENKLHLNPDISTPITDPYNVSLAVTQKSSGVTVVFDRVPRKAESRRDFAVSLYNTIHSAYELTDVTTAEQADSIIAAAGNKISDWGDLGTDSDAKIAFAFLTVNGVMNVEGELNPYDSMSRAEAMIVMYNLVGKGSIPTADKFNGVTDPVTFSDVDGTLGQAVFDAIMFMANSGVVKGYMDGRFGPNDTFDEDAAAGIIQGFIEAMGSVTYTVSKSSPPMPVQNKVFNSLVTIRSDDISDDSFGGMINFDNCVFKAGIRIELGSKMFNVNLNGSTVTAGKVITVLAKDGVTPNVYDFATRVELQGVAGGTNVVASVPTQVTCNSIGGSFTLNGVDITGKNSNVSDYGFSALIKWACGDDHVSGFDFSLNDHSACNQSLRYPSVDVNGEVASVSLVNSMDPRVFLGFPAGSSGTVQVALGSNTTDTLHLNSSFNDNVLIQVLGQIVGKLEIVGHVDVSAATVGTYGSIEIGTWGSNTAATIGNHRVKITGGNENFVNIISGSGAVIDATNDPGFKINLTGVSATSVPFVLDPHFFDAGGSDYQVYVGTTIATPSIQYVLMMGGENGAPVEADPSLVNVLGEAAEPYVKTHLVPTTPITAMPDGDNYVLKVTYDGVTLIYRLQVRP